jgi:hypothetical protein
MEDFVREGSIVRRIWGRSETILFIFAGSAAEFALNKAVDWLYFTGRLPADPIGRLFSTVQYARDIVFAPKEKAEATIDRITMIHSSVERARGDVIPGWAYRDVLFMLIHYSIASFELLERKMDPVEKEELYNVFFRIGDRMHLEGLPPTYAAWLPVREAHMHEDLQCSKYTIDLFKQYEKHLGKTRFKILKEAQLLILPPHVVSLLNFRHFSLLRPAVPVYRLLHAMGLSRVVRKLLLPPAYIGQINALDTV